MSNATTRKPRATAPATAPVAAPTCRCGCGAEVKKTYRPGHDARHVSDLAYALPRRDVATADAIAAVEAAGAALQSAKLTAKFARLIQGRLANPTEVDLESLVEQASDED